jgi:hypothetical protein
MSAPKRVRGGFLFQIGSGCFAADNNASNIAYSTSDHYIDLIAGRLDLSQSGFDRCAF